MTQEQVAAYLKRINFEGEAHVDVDTLNRIQLCHLLTVPYENFDILARADMPLSEAELFDKIVLRHRGGYCFELNGLLGALLRAIGFGVEDYFARFLKDEPAIPMRRHRVLVVTVGNERYLADVGVGVSIPRKPLKLEEGIQGDYDLKKEQFFGWVLYDRGRRLYSFTEEPQLNLDYEMAHFWCRFAAESPFIVSPMVAIRTPKGRITLDGDLFKIFTPQGVEQQRFTTRIQWREAVKEYFGLTNLPWEDGEA